MDMKRRMNMKGINLNKIAPGKIIALGFMMVILVGAILLWLPISANEGVEVSFLDALFTATSAVCVTGLATVDPGDTFNVFGRTVLALLIQTGGLGVTCIGVGIIWLTGKRVGLKQRTLVREALNLNSFKGVVKLVRAILLMTLSFELIGAILSFMVFREQYETWDAIGISIFHAVSSFNNAGFDILGGFKNLLDYQSNVLLNLTTCGLIICGGLGFLVHIDVIKNRSFKKLTFHSKVVLTMTISLLTIGTLLIRWTEDVPWLVAFFNSTSARTAGFSTYPIGNFTEAGLLVMIVLMFIGASPGSTGGGIKTTTLFVLIQSIKSTATNQHCQAFKRSIPLEAIMKAFMITLLSLTVVIMGTLAICIFEPYNTFAQNIFEVVSAFGTVGLSTGITPELVSPSKIVLIIIMYIGRVGPLTVASLWFTKEKSSLKYSEGLITIG